ncbi:long-chain-fatty-acid--CoA ligase 1 [Trichonephila clavipes]|uniref:Long-chain-fatty-acid--CoA ligase 1 n=1 Tax=Trichonephila clavipes TaxID=2585209 RepID=A0A8X6RJZ9_TRICX|nr:long-chain-fatty-acid--CoA ligase 1 [Trichonephila clavipes]
MYCCPDTILYSKKKTDLNIAGGNTGNIFFFLLREKTEGRHFAGTLHKKENTGIPGNLSGGHASLTQGHEQGIPVTCCMVQGIYSQKYLSHKAATKLDLAVTSSEGSVKIIHHSKVVGNGALAIVDRKKHIFKLQQGEYVAPEKVENIYLRNLFVSQVFVHGDSLKSCVVGIIVPEMEAVLQWCKERGITGEWNHICQNKVVKEHILEELITLGRKSGLKSFEQVKDIYLHPRLFTIEDGLLTPTLKTKRLECRKYFKPQIDAMYSHLV